MTQYFSIPSSLKNAKILLVEPDSQIEELLLVIFDVAGAEVLMATSADDALAYLLENPLDVLICDIQLSDFAGCEVIQKLRSRPESSIKQIPAIAIAATVNAYSGAAIERITTESGFNRFLPLPVVPEKIVQTVLELTQNSRDSQQ